MDSGIISLTKKSFRKLWSWYAFSISFISMNLANYMIEKFKSQNGDSFFIAYLVGNISYWFIIYLRAKE